MWGCAAGLQKKPKPGRPGDGKPTGPGEPEAGMERLKAASATTRSPHGGNGDAGTAGLPEGGK